jgi:hypothetical protein
MANSNAALKAVPVARFDPGTDVRRKALADLKHVSDKTMVCRGDHHDWPQLVPGPLPKGMRAIPTGYRDGSYEVTQTCRACGRQRYKLTLPNHVWDASAGWRYRGGPKDFSHPGEDLNRADFTAELGRRLTEHLVTWADETPQVQS